MLAELPLLLESTVPLHFKNNGLRRVSPHVLSSTLLCMTRVTITAQVSHLSLYYTARMLDFLEIKYNKKDFGAALHAM